jgi:hypothetical protein
MMAFAEEIGAPFWAGRTVPLPHPTISAIFKMPCPAPSCCRIASKTRAANGSIASATLLFAKHTEKSY